MTLFSCSLQRPQPVLIYCPTQPQPPLTDNKADSIKLPPMLNARFAITVSRNDDNTKLVQNLNITTGSSTYT